MLIEPRLLEMERESLGYILLFTTLAACGGTEVTVGVGDAEFGLAPLLLWKSVVGSESNSFSLSPAFGVDFILFNEVSKYAICVSRDLT